LAGEVGDEETITIAAGEIPGIRDGAQVGTEREHLIHGLDIRDNRATIDAERREGRDTEIADIEWAGIRDDIVI